jgi:hypothetical protein
MKTLVALISNPCTDITIESYVAQDQVECLALL